MNRLYGFLHRRMLVGSLVFAAGCGGAISHPGVWTEADAEANIKRKMDLTEVDLAPAAGGFSGTGKNADGESFKIAVQQNATTKRLDYDAKGDRGTNEEGFFESD